MPDTVADKLIALGPGVRLSKINNKASSPSSDLTLRWSEAAWRGISRGIPQLYHLNSYTWSSDEWKDRLYSFSKARSLSHYFYLRFPFPFWTNCIKSSIKNGNNMGQLWLKEATNSKSVTRLRGKVDRKRTKRPRVLLAIMLLPPPGFTGGLPKEAVH